MPSPCTTNRPPRRRPHHTTTAAGDDRRQEQPPPPGGEREASDARGGRGEERRTLPTKFLMRNFTCTFYLPNNDQLHFHKRDDEGSEVDTRKTSTFEYFVVSTKTCEVAKNSRSPLITMRARGSTSQVKFHWYKGHVQSSYFSLSVRPNSGTSCFSSRRRTTAAARLVVW